MRRSSVSFAILCLCLFLSGCLTSESPRESEEEPGWNATIDPLLFGTQAPTPVVANIGIIQDQGGQVIVFTEPLEGTFSIVTLPTCAYIEPTCPHWGTAVSESYNLSEDTSFAPVRVSAGAVGENNSNVWIVSDIGILYPSNEKQGRVVLFDYQTQESTTAIEGIGRTVCAEPGDFDGDGDVDLTLCEFGHDEGTVSWLENEDDSENWTQHILDPRPGSIHAMPVDIDGDDDLDIVAILSQTVEEVMLYRNDGTGNFTSESLHHSNLTYYGMSGLSIADLDKDGDNDIVFTNGDTMDFDIPEGVDPNQLHGVAWLENDGTGGFSYHDITRNWGAYDTAITDIDNDGDIDMVLICYQVDDLFSPETNRTQIILLEQHDSMWIRHDITTTDSHRMLTITSIDRDSFLVASHDPMNQGGDLFTLAELTLTFTAP
jgi:hypothetical protein